MLAAMLRRSGFTFTGFSSLLYNSGSGLSGRSCGCTHTGGGQHVGQKGAQRPLPGAAAHLLVVKEAPHRAPLGGGRFQKAPQGGPGAGQIVQPGAEDELAFRAGGGALLAAVEQDVRAQDVLYGAAASAASSAS